MPPLVGNNYFYKLLGNVVIWLRMLLDLFIYNSCMNLMQGVSTVFTLVNSRPISSLFNSFNLCANVPGTNE